LLYFLLGPLLLFAALVAADARGGPLRQRIHGEPEGGIRYVVVFGLAVTFVGIMAALAAG